MRIIYNYTFNVTKKLNRQELLPFLEEYLKNNNIKYKNILFSLYCYKMNDTHKMTYFEKLCANDKYWDKYKTLYDCNIAKNTYVSGVSNLENDSWICNDLYINDDLNQLIEKIQSQLIEMPKTTCNYRISFNDIYWDSASNLELDIQDSWTSSLYPLSSNITLWKDYLDNRFITLNFEMYITNYDIYLEKFFNAIDCPYYKTVTFVLDNKEKENYNNANNSINRLLNRIDRKIDLNHVENINIDRLHIKQTLQSIFKTTNFKLESVNNGSYSFSNIDKYNNKINILFDYDKSSKSFGATLSYSGVGYKHSIKFYDIDKKISDSIIQEYVIGVIQNIELFIHDYVPIIVEKYNKTPEWLKWD